MNECQENVQAQDEAPPKEEKPPNPADNDRIKVFLRIRPLIKNEVSVDFKIEDQKITIFTPTKQNTSYFCVDKSFTFRKIMEPSTTQQEVFEIVAQPLLDTFINGQDVLMFCYGITNAGKTYTVSGTPDNPGILKRSMDFIFPKIMTPRYKYKPKLEVSFVEIYNERIHDLLDSNNQNLKLCINTKGDVEVKGCSEVPVNSTDDITYIVKKGEEKRHSGTTELNSRSSRSHSVFRLKLTWKERVSWLSIVDLAGSERLSVIKSTNTSFKEACNINKSMLTLGKCIRMIRKQGSSDKKKQQIPFRESKLTYLFKNFFEPVNRPSKAVMIINFSPSMSQIEDNLFALQFAAEASQCVIRQVSRPNGELVKNPYENINEIETKEDIEAKIKEKLKREMDEFILQKEEQYNKQIKKMNVMCQKIYLNSLETSLNGGNQQIIQNYFLQLQKLDKEIENLQKENELIKNKNRATEIELNNILLTLERKKNNFGNLSQNE